MTTRGRLAVLVTGVALAAALVACTDDEPTVVLPSTTVSSPTATATTPPSPTTSRTPQQQAMDTYQDMWRAYLKAGETADPNLAELSDHATGHALETLQSGLRSLRDDGMRIRGQYAFHTTVESVQPATNPTKIRIRDCLDTSKTEQYKANGDPYQDTPGGNRLTLADVELIAGIWKVTNFGVREVGTCTG